VPLSLPSGEPNNIGEENCGEFSQVPDYAWNDDDCSEKQAFICKMKATEDPDNPVIDDGGATTPAPNRNNLDLQCFCISSSSSSSCICLAECHESPGWQYDRDTRMCYLILTDKMSWSDARTECEYRAGHLNGGDLASINSYDESRYLQSEQISVIVGHPLTNCFCSGMVENGGLVDSCWIGMSTQNDRGAFDWSDGTAVAFTNWNDGEPNNVNNNEDCVEVLLGLWNDDECNRTRSAICEKKGEYAAVHTYSIQYI
jgi:hypothetical protein